MKSFSRDNSRSAMEIFKRRAVMLFALIPIIALIIACNDIYYEIVNINARYQTNIEELQNRKIEIVNYILEERKNQMKLQNTYVSQHLLHYLYHEYQGDPVALENSLNTRDPNNPTMIIYDNVLQSDITVLKMADIDYSGETLFICDKDGIIADASRYGKSTNVTWEQVVEGKNNKPLTQNTIKLLLNRSRNTLIWESGKAIKYTLNDTSIIYPDRDTIDLIIQKYGLQALKEYNVLVPEYIDTDTNVNTLNTEGFSGSPEIDNRIIMVREANLYSILEPYLFDIKSYDYVIAKYEENYKSVVTTKVITCIVICGFLICSFFLCLLFATDFNDGREEDDSK